MTKIRRLRLAMGLSLSQLAREMGMAKSCISRVETRAGSPASPLVVWALCKYYGVHVADYFTPERYATPEGT